MDSQAESEIDRAAAVLKSGGLVAFPTETVYGIGGDATNAATVARIFAVKGRPGTNPLIVHVADAGVARRYVSGWPESAERLAQIFWPGPLTLVLPKGELVVPAVTAGLGTVGIRCPDHPVALELLRKFGGAVAAPSANRSNRISPTTAEHVRREFGEQIDMILDGGACRVGIESTVIDLTSRRPAILRPGAVSREQLEDVLGPVDFSADVPDHSKPATSPGRQAVHYSPATPAYRFGESDLGRLENLFSPRLGRTAVFLIIAGTELARGIREWITPARVMEMPAAAEDYARRLYAALHEADDGRADVILVQEPPIGPQWEAVRDRVSKATRPAAEAR